MESDGDIERGTQPRQHNRSVARGERGCGYHGFDIPVRTGRMNRERRLIEQYAPRVVLYNKSVTCVRYRFRHFSLQPNRNIAGLHRKSSVGRTATHIG